MTFIQAFRAFWAVLRGKVPPGFYRISYLPPEKTDPFMVNGAIHYESSTPEDAERLHDWIRTVTAK